MQISAMAHILTWSNLLSDTTVEALDTHASRYHYQLSDYLEQQQPVDMTQVTSAINRYYGLQPPSIQKDTITNIKQLNDHALEINKAYIVMYDPIGFTALKQDTHKKFGFITPKHFYTLQSSISQQTLHQTTQSVTQQLNQIINHAIQLESSDIHIEPFQQGYRIRYRIDGLLQSKILFSKHTAKPIIRRLKILSECDIAESRLPQDGRFQFHSNTGLKRECRLSTCPMHTGEKAVIRLLSPNQRILHFNELGLEHAQKKQLLRAIEKPQGVILVTGPTGSGKTQTLYTILNHINDISKNIVTIEDPVEIHLQGINQVQIQDKAGLNYQKTLRAFLRQDPDIIMIGEIRDSETASIAIRAAETGHLVLATLHTMNTAESLNRLIQLGIPLHYLTTTVSLIIAQRLIRRYHAKNGEFSGRTGIFEILEMNTLLKNSLKHPFSATHLFDAARKQGMQTLHESGQHKVLSGVTTAEEVNRVISCDSD